MSIATTEPSNATEQKYHEIYPEGRRSLLQPGTKAPDFRLRSTPDQWVTLRELTDQALIVCFYPADWSPVCGDQVSLYNELLPEFQKLSANLVGISVDGVWCHSAFAKYQKIHFPLLSDFEPKGAVARSYGVYRDGDGVSERALFVLEPGGTIHWSHVSPIGVNPGAGGILAALEDIQTGKHL